MATKATKKLKEVNPRENFVEMEQRLLKWWYEDGIVDKYLHKNDKAKENFSFIDGPITANNPMGVHHAWGRTYKDVMQRYKNLQGFEQRFQNGFDCQGLWVEVEVEKALGFNSKKDIQDFGLGKFTDACVARVNKFSGIQTEQSKRLGMFMDWDNSYYTMSETNNLYIWNFLKLCNEKGLLYKSKASTTWCPRCETGLSQHEASDGYKEVTDRAVYVLFKLADTENEYVLVWTTTPWTLSANVLLAVNPELEYVKANYEGKVVYVGKKAAKRLALTDVEDIDLKVLVGRHYEKLYDIPAQKDVEHYVVEWDLVDAESGSGVVHIAPGCGQEDFELGQALGNVLSLSPLDSTGRFGEGYGDLTGKYAHDVADEVFKYLEDKKLLFKTESYTHSYPHCWRCKTKCLFRLEDNWFINLQKVKADLKKNAAAVNWMPEFAGKRMQDWLDNMGDWMISRKRFYGLSLPFYMCDKCNKLHVVGSKEELRELAVDPSKVDKLPSLHRPWIDEVQIKCTECGDVLTRITDVGDCWLDAGVVPFSTLKYLDDRKYWEKWFPADYVTENIEQVRLWFYSMLVFGTIFEDQVPFDLALCFAELRDEKNERMSKTKPNYVEFNVAADKVGTDMIRWNFVTASVATNMRFGWPTLEEVRRRFYLPLWNSYSYLVTYANMHGWNHASYDVEKLKEFMDRWMVAKFRELSRTVEKKMDKFDMAYATREIEQFVLELSTWYIRRSRDRFKNGDSDAIGTLHYVLMNLTKLLAPFVPFVSEEMYQNLAVNLGVKDAKVSVHLEDYPHFDTSEEDEKVLNQMESAKSLCSMGLKLRDQNRLKLRQPLAKAYVNLKEAELLEVVKGELNVKEIESVDKAPAKDKMATLEDRGLFVALDVEVTDELQQEGWLNEVARQVQVLRKEAKFELGDKVVVKYSTDSDAVAAMMEAKAEALMQMVSAKKVVKEEAVEGTELQLLDAKIMLAVEK